jgi:hypothetical protein
MPETTLGWTFRACRRPAKIAFREPTSNLRPVADSTHEWDLEWNCEQVLRSVPRVGAVRGIGPISFPIMFGGMCNRARIAALPVLFQSFSATKLSMTEQKERPDAAYATLGAEPLRFGWSCQDPSDWKGREPDARDALQASRCHSVGDTAAALRKCSDCLQSAR